MPTDAIAVENQEEMLFMFMEIHAVVEVQLIGKVELKKVVRFCCIM